MRCRVPAPCPDLKIEFSRYIRSKLGMCEVSIVATFRLATNR
jgi:hypothetical protein